MPWAETQLYIFGLYGLYLALVYLFYEPHVAYPGIAIPLAVIAQVASWRGRASIFLLIGLVAAFGCAALVRRLRGQPLLVRKASNLQMYLMLITQGMVGAIIVTTAVEIVIR
jgi:hypothetical protein